MCKYKLVEVKEYKPEYPNSLSDIRSLLDYRISEAYNKLITQLLKDNKITDSDFRAVRFNQKRYEKLYKNKKGKSYLRITLRMGS